ncbi:hypothetical protein FRX31_023258 [Thalictrum thalictroides]|uniref:Reverse transcriptase zinc-binding domain-containing protein n=1 Tax=Thalictrum thalictroides TaxID=46969 RepID=A0A7J6VSG1_THATH|nr:hypothetical protein FRX31_023258 [Thalictrum thalictroides]
MVKTLASGRIHGIQMASFENASGRKTKLPVNLYKVVWFSNKMPRHSFITWLAIRNGLKTLDRLKSYGVVQNDTCVLTY